MNYGHEGSHVSAPLLVIPEVSVHDKISTVFEVAETVSLAHVDLEGEPAPCSLEQILPARDNFRRPIHREREYKHREPEKSRGRNSFHRKENSEQRTLTVKTTAQGSQRCSIV
jgi:hypothetical protein